MSRLYIITLLFFSVSMMQAQTIWEGDRTTFTKENNADPTDAANQDRITENVWITRGDVQGIFNIKTEDQYASLMSPLDTEWAFGTTADIATLNFTPWQTAVTNNPPGSVGKDMVLHLISEDIYIDLKFLSWSVGANGGGGFSYERTTDNVAAINDVDVSRSVRVFPNPMVTTNLTIHLDDSGLQQPIIEVLDITGRKIAFDTLPANGNSIMLQLPDAAPGLYYVVLRENDMYAALRVLKQ